MAHDGSAQSGFGAPPTEALDIAFQRNAERHPDRLALADDPDRRRWNASSPLRLTYAEAQRRVAALAALFREKGLQPGSLVAIATPNAVETVLLFLAALRAELVVAPVPALWRARDFRRHLAPLKPRAMIATGTVEGEPTGSRWRAAAAEIGSVDILLGFGAGLPADVKDIGGAFQRPPVSETRSAGNGNRIATISAGTAEENGAAQYLARSHRQWEAASAPIREAAGIADGADLLCPFEILGFTGIAAGLVPWLRSAGTLHLHQFRTLAALLDHAAAMNPAALLVPGPLLRSVLENGLPSDGPSAPTIVAVWKGQHPDEGFAFDGTRRIVDLTVIDDLAAFASRRTGDRPSPLPLGAAGTGGSSSLETRLEGRSQRAGDRPLLIGGTLSVRGEMVPSPAAMTLPVVGFVHTRLQALPGGFVRSGTQCRLIDGPGLVPDGHGDGFIGVGGQAVPSRELDKLFSAMDDVTGAASFAYRSPNGMPKLGAAVVPRPGTSVGTSSFCRSLSLAGAALHHLPDAVFSLPSLPRRADGAIDREKIAAMLQPPEPSRPREVVIIPAV